MASPPRGARTRVTSSGDFALWAPIDGAAAGLPALPGTDTCDGAAEAVGAKSAPSVRIEMATGAARTARPPLPSRNDGRRDMDLPPDRMRRPEPGRYTAYRDCRAVRPPSRLKHTSH